MDKVLHLSTSFFLTAALFYSLLFSLVYKPPITFNYESFIEIDLNFEESVVEEKAPIEEEAVEEVRERRSVDSLFGSSDIKKVTKDLTDYKYKSPKIDTKKSTLDFEKLFKDSRNKSIGSKQPEQKKETLASVGEESEEKYLKLLHTELLKAWKTKESDAGKTAQISFVISKDGSFVYFIKQISSDESFRRRLEISLERLKEKRLPPTEKTIKVLVNFIAKE